MTALEVRGPTLTLRYPDEADAARIFELAADPEVTRWFSWGPYSVPAEAEAYVAGCGRDRDAGTRLDLLMTHAGHGPVGITGLSELSARDRHATVGTWFGRAFWGAGLNVESKAIVAALAFGHLGLDRLTAWSNARNGRSQRALERAGFRREGVLRDWHRHGGELHDVVVFGLTRRAWERSDLHEVEVTVAGTLPPAFTVA